MPNIIAKLGFYGDIHLHSKNYGAHRNYPQESLKYFKTITSLTEKNELTHLFGLGDLTFGRFHTLEYRESVEKELETQFKLVKGNRYELKGNHDSAGYGMTEYEYYVSKGLILPSTNLSIGNVNISMVDSGKIESTNIIEPSDTCHNIVLAHDYLKFQDTVMADYGKSFLLDEYEPWFGVDYIICGHIHNYELFDGLIVKGEAGHRAMVNYLGSMSRPSYREGHMDTVGHFVVITIYDDGQLEYDIQEVELLPIETSFNLSIKEEEKGKKIEKEHRLDISDIVQQLNSHKRVVGNPEDIILAMEGIPEKYKTKAIELLKAGGA